MKRTYACVLLIAMTFIALPILGQGTGNACSISISIAERDTLGNVNQGFDADGKKWFQSKVSKQYPDICYAEQDPDAGIWFLIDISNQAVGNVQYPVYTLKIARIHNGKSDVLRTFQRTKAGKGVSGSFSNPEHDVIIDAVKWLAASDLVNQ